MSEWTAGQWPDNICKGKIAYTPSSVYDGGFILRDASHGIPVFGSVTAATFNYPGQTEAITSRLVHCWNLHDELVAAVDFLKSYYGADWVLDLLKRANAAPPTLAERERK